MSSTLNFPKSSNSLLADCLLGTANVGYKSTNSASVKSVNVNCPASFNFKFTNYQAQPMIINISINYPSFAYIYKNGTFYQNKTISSSNALFYKQYVLPSLSTQSVCEINDFVANFSLQFFPQVNNSFGTTDVYTFYIKMAYTITSNVSQLYYLTSAGLTLRFLFNTSQSSTSLTNFTYYTGSSTNSGYSPYSLYQDIILTNSWDGSINNTYYPSTSYTDWTGLYQLQGLYSRELWISDKNINFKNQLIPGTLSPQVQSINWYSQDPTSKLIGKIETNKTLSSMNFYVDSTEIAQGFKFTGGNINSTSRQQTWYISANTSGNSYTPAGKILGSSDNSTSSRWDKVTTYGGATSTDWNTTYAVFTASQAGTYHIQLFLFNNSTSTSGRWLQAGGTCILGGSGTQYITFNQSYLTTDSGASTISLMYYINANQTFYFYCPNQSPDFYYGDGHTILQIIKML